MATTQYQLEDLILSSRSLTLEEKQELLKRLDTYDAAKKEKLRAVLEQEFNSFRHLDSVALSAVQQFTQTLRTVTETIAA